MKGRRPGLATIQKRMAGAYSGPAPDCPVWLDDIARAEWERVIPELERMGVMTPVDSMLLASYCRAYSQWVKCELQVEADGLMIAGPQGNPVLHPAARHAAKLLQEVRKAASEFGFSPASRSRVNAPPKLPEEVSEFSKFQAGA